MGARHVLDGKDIDLVLSGVNRGRNVGEDVILFRHVAGAMRDVLASRDRAVRSLTIRARPPAFWQTGLRFAPDIIRRVLANGVRDDVLINVKLPGLRPEEVKGMRCRRWGGGGRSGFSRQRADGRGILITGSPMPAKHHKARSRTDMAALDDHYIAVTPLKIDITDEPTMTGSPTFFPKRFKQRPQARGFQRLGERFDLEGLLQVGLAR